MRRADPIYRDARATGISFLENKKEFSKGKRRLVPPGQHAYKKKWKSSLFALQNKEKKKVCRLYGLKEKQLKNLVRKLKQKGNIQQSLLTSLESRLDNLVFRSGLVPTRRFARQWVKHGHFLVNNSKEDIPSHLIKPSNNISNSNTVITLEEKMHQNEMIKEEISKNKTSPAFLEVDKEKLTINYLHYPSLKELFETSPELKKINLSLVIEWYNKKI